MGQGSQYVNMMRGLREIELITDTFAEADRVMTPLLDKPLSEIMFVDPADTAAVSKAENDLRQTADHAAGGHHHQYGNYAHARGLWHSSRHGHGSQRR